MFRKFMKDESGATAIEYGLIAALVAVAIIAALQTMTIELNSVFEDVSNALKNEPAPDPDA